jgi:dienelactone hydrolase
VSRIPLRWLQSAGLLLLMLLASPLPAFVGERVSFPSLDLDPSTGEPVKLSGLFFTPDPSAGGFPAVIVLHGCDGMYSALPSRRGRLTPRHQAMADLLVAEGYAVLFPDSFNPRGRREVCTQPVAEQTIRIANRRLDVLGALEYLRARSDIATGRIAVLGWSHGGSTVLASINARSATIARYLRAQPSGVPYLRAAIAFYPGCTASLRDPGGFAPAAPLVMFVGESDDWTAAAPCVQLGARLRTAGEPVEVRAYPDTFHGFDNPGSFAPLHLDVPNGVNPGRGVTVARNPAARADAYARVRTMLRETLAP